MAARLSTGLVNKINTEAPISSILANCLMDIYSGTQPATADSAATGVLLCTVTVGSAANTAETKAVGSLTIAGAAGSVDTVTVNAIDILGGSVAFITDLATTVAAVAAKINANPKSRYFVATSAAGVITLTAKNGLGTLPNTWAVSGTYTTMTGGSYVAMTGGVNNVNGLRFGLTAAGVLSKDATQSWSGTVLANGTAGWFRIRENGDSGTADTTTAARYDGAIASSGAQMNLAVQTLTAGAPFTVPTGSIMLAMS